MREIKIKITKILFLKLAKFFIYLFSVGKHDAQRRHVKRPNFSGSILALFLNP